MTSLEFTLGVFGVSLVAGLLGALLGIGGGIVVVPALTLGFGVDIRFAVGASIISVIATSSGAAAAYVRERLANLRVAMFLEVATTAGALTGAALSGVVDPRWLFVGFGLVLGWSAFSMVRNLREPGDRSRPPDRLADRLSLHSSWFDPAQGRRVDYRVTRSGTGFGLMYVAGTVSGLLGVGAGALKVAALDLAMGLPLKVSTATSNLMIGVTAAASAGVYFARGDIDPLLAAPVATGVLLGAIAGARLLGRIANRTLRLAFVGLLTLLAIQMLLRGLR